MSRGRIRRLAAIAGTTLAMSMYGLAVAPSALAAVTCSEAVAGQLQVNATAADTVDIQLGTAPVAGSVEIFVDDVSPPAVNLCAGQPTLAQTTSITVSGDSSTAQTVNLWLSDNLDDLADWGSVKFNISLGTDVSADGLFIYNADTSAAGAVDVALGANGIDLDNDGVVDVTTSGVDRFEIGSESLGDDVISAAGSDGTGGPFTASIQGLDGPGMLADLDVDVERPGIWSAGSDGVSGDYFVGGTGNDEFSGGVGYATCAGGLGDDTLFCDGADYSGSATGVIVNLAATVGSANGEGLDNLGDTLNAEGFLWVYDVSGSDQNDTITGRAEEANWIWGGGGDDTLAGGASVGADTEDTASYSGSNGVQVDLAAGTATGDHGNDTLTGFENAQGGKGADKLMGSVIDNSLEGLGGNDKLNGRGGDDDGDSLDGGNGSDTASYKWASSVIVELTGENGDACDPEEGSADPVGYPEDALANIENAKLTSGDDSFTGSQFQNKVWPMGGQNTLVGDPVGCAAGGGDTLDYSKGYGNKGVTVNMAGGATAGDSATLFEAAIGSNGDDFFTGNELSNSIDGGKGADVVRGGSGDDDIKGGKGRDSIRGGSGDDTINGGKGRDEGFGGSGDDWGKSLEITDSIELGPSA